MLPTRRILLADDDAGLRVGVAELLGSLGLDVVQAETGLEAVELARVAKVHAALLDLHMPGCSGLEVLVRLRSDLRSLPCIVYSGRLTRALEQEAFSAGAVAVLHKPVAPDLLRREVLRAVSLSALPIEPPPPH
jgi:two-component system, LuxR family, response regulator FixJ